MGVLDVSRTVSGLDAAIELARLKASTKVKPSDSWPLLNPTQLPPTTSINFSSFDTPLASKRSNLINVSHLPQSQQRDSGTMAGAPQTQPTQRLSQSPQKEKWNFPAEN